MRPRLIALPASLAILLGALALHASKPVATSNAENLIDAPRHPVTVQMQREADAIPGSPAPEIDLFDTAGKEVRLSKLLEAGPVVVVMIKDGCPCSLESQEFFNRIARNYIGKATFLGVMNAGRPVADKYKDDFNVPFPIVSETGIHTFQAYRSRQSVYTTVIDRSGIVRKVYPGYNVESVKELNDLVAKLAGVPAKPVDTAMAAKTMTSGCYFYERGAPRQ